MKFEYRASLDKSKEVVDVIKFEGRVAKCSDNIDRDVDDFNTIFFSAEKFKKDILGIVEEKQIEEVETPKQTKKNKSA